MLVQYTVASERIKLLPPRGDSKVVEFETPGAWDASKTVSSGRHPIEVPALRRTDEFERLTLPGETDEPWHK